MDTFVNDALNSAFAGLPENESAEAVAEMLDKYGLRWTVSKQKLLLPGKQRIAKQRPPHQQHSPKSGRIY